MVSIVSHLIPAHRSSSICNAEHPRSLIQTDQLTSFASTPLLHLLLGTVKHGLGHVPLLPGQLLVLKYSVLELGLKIMSTFHELPLMAAALIRLNKRAGVATTVGY